MEKLVAFLASVKTLALVVSSSDAFPAEVRAEASNVAASAHDVELFLSHPDANRLWEYIKHHGNLPGTPESRGEVQG